MESFASKSGPIVAAAESTESLDWAVATLNAGFEVFWCHCGADKACQNRSWLALTTHPSRSAEEMATHQALSNPTYALWCVAGHTTREDAIRAMCVPSTDCQVCASAGGKRSHSSACADDSQIQYFDWATDDGSFRDLAAISIEDIGSVVLGASSFFVAYKSHANKFTNQEDCFLSIFAKPQSRALCCMVSCLGGSSDPPHYPTGGLHVSFVGGSEAVQTFATAVKVVMESRGLPFPQGPAEYVTFKL